MAIVQQPTQPATFTQDGEYHPHPHANGSHAHPPSANGGTLATAHAKSRKPSKPKKQLTPEEVNSMIHSKINQLEEVTVKEEEEEVAIADAVKTANKEMLQVIHSDEVDKINILHQKYMELFQNMKRLERDHARTKKQHELMRKEKDAGKYSKSELAKTTSLKSKLEQLCRELQKENKRIKEESAKLSEKEQQKREELSTRFEQTIWEIKNKMEEDGDEKRKRAEDSELMKQKFASFLDQYDLREKHFSCILKSKDLELQLSAAKLAQAQEQQVAVLSNTSSETAVLKEQNEHLREKVRVFERTEQELRKQVGVYVDKFRQVEETLNKSNELFLTFRGEMEQMTKKTKKLEKENATIKTKYDTMNKNILEMAEERTTNARTLETLTKKSQKLENLCRALQAERDELKKQLESREVSAGNEVGSCEDENREEDDDESLN